VRTLPPGIVPIKTSGDRAPLFAVPGLGGNSLGFVHLARLLDRRQPLYGIDSRGLDGAHAAIHEMAAIAADNIDRVKAVQPAGPYFLIGACFGGVVAYEMARQLAASGDRVGMLVMLDPSAPFTYGEGHPRGADAARGAPYGAAHYARFLVERIGLHARTFAELDGPARRAFVREKVAILGDVVRQRDPFRGDRSELYQRAVLVANRSAGRAYRPVAQTCPTVLCLTRGRPVRGARDHRTDWLELVPQCGEPVYVAGRDTGDMANPPHVFGLAEHVNAWLDAAFADRAAPRPVHPRHGSKSLSRLGAPS
jgi:thioesterase domain-containing protein